MPGRAFYSLDLIQFSNLIPEGPSGHAHDDVHLRESGYICGMQDRSSMRIVRSTSLGIRNAPTTMDGGEAEMARPKDPLAAELGRRGGLKGGKARAAALTAEERSAIARRAAKARWK